MSNKSHTPEEIMKMNAYIDNMTQDSDRGAVLSFSAALEDRLKEIILLFLRDCKSASELLDGFNAPLGTFSAKILMAHALGLLTDKELREIQTLRKIRNRFAHSWEKIDFETNDIKAMLYTLPVLGLSAEAKTNPKVYFNNWARVFIARLLWRNHYSEKEKRKEGDFDNLSKVIDNHPHLL
ncbi:TPA: transcriptional regulator [Acinetobacter baumannii]|jgi:hypothetical protein|nr:transcriptional regulator [Acinetobacter baumannii]